MKKDILKRVLCLVCCLSLTLGVFAYRPTKAEAVFVSPAAALGASLIATVIVATTAQFFVSSGAADTIGTAVDGLVTEFIDAASLVSEYTTDTFFEEIAGGATVLEAGAIQLSASAGSLMGAFIGWLQGEKGLTAGGSVVDVFSVSGLPLADGGLFELSVNQTTSSDGPYDIGSTFYESLTFASGSKCVLSRSGSYTYVTLYGPTGVQLSQGSRIADYVTKPAAIAFDGNTIRVILDVGGANEVLSFNYNVVRPSSWLGDSYSFVTESLNLQPNEKFQELPNELPDYSYLVVNPALEGLSITDHQAAADSIMGAIYAGTLSPTVAVEAEATDVPGTDTDEEEDVIAVPGADADLLDWTKYIGQKVAAVPQAIADAIAGIFVPDAALVNQITGAFSEKFGFVETLKTIGDDLFGMTPSSEPPVVWIHLEDAEGKYYYGGTVKALDMSWFQRYKEDVDRILGGFLWVAYLWLLFRRLPDILGGAGLVIADSQYIGDGMYVDGNTGEITGRFMYRRSKRL